MGEWKAGLAKKGVGNHNSGRKSKAEELAGCIALKKMEIELARVQNAMADKDLTGEQYKTLVEAVDKLTKNIQLLGGKPTENIAGNIDLLDYVKFLQNKNNSGDREDIKDELENTGDTRGDISQQNV